MLTLVTELRVFRVPRAALVSYVGLRITTAPLVYMKHVFVVELLAALKGEDVSFLLMRGAVSLLCGMSPEDSTLVAGPLPFVRREGFVLETTMIPLCKYTLARHFSLIKDFIEEYPEASEVALPGRTKIHQTIFSLFNLNGTKVSLDAEVLYLLQTLNPITELYYLLYDIGEQHPAVIEGICSRITEDERSDLRELHATRVLHTPYVLPLPDEGAGNAILAALSMGRLFLCHHGLTMLPTHPSFLFLNACTYRAVGWATLATSLIDIGFDDVTPYYAAVDEVVRALVAVLPLCSDEQVCRVLSMLGVGGLSSVSFYAPYQTIIPESIEYGAIMDIVVALSQRPAFATTLDTIVGTLSTEHYSPSSEADMSDSDATLD